MNSTLMPSAAGTDFNSFPLPEHKKVESQPKASESKAEGRVSTQKVEYQPEQSLRGL